MTPRNPREYGLPNADKVLGPPTWVAAPAGMCCRDCGTLLARVEVRVEARFLRGGHGRGMYLGCPACAWASPMLMMAAGVESPAVFDWRRLMPPGPTLTAVATWVVAPDTRCPACQCSPMVEVTDTKTGRVYHGCPACPWPHTKMPAPDARH